MVLSRCSSTCPNACCRTGSSSSCSEGCTGSRSGCTCCYSPRACCYSSSCQGQQSCYRSIDNSGTGWRPRDGLGKHCLIRLPLPRYEVLRYDQGRQISVGGGCQGCWSACRSRQSLHTVTTTPNHSTKQNGSPETGDPFCFTSLVQCRCTHRKGSLYKPKILALRISPVRYTTNRLWRLLQKASAYSHSYLT